MSQTLFRSYTSLFGRIKATSQPIGSEQAVSFPVYKGNGNLEEIKR